MDVAAVLARNVVGSLITWRADTEEDREIKRILAPVVLLVTAVFVANLALRWGSFDDVQSTASAAAALMGPATWALATRISAKRTAEFGVLCYAAAFFLVDVSRAADLEARFWPFIVPLLDAVLVANVRLPIANGVICAMLLYKHVVAAEQISGFGLFEAVRDSAVPDVCSCASPPCAVRAADGLFSAWALSTVFLVDYYITRRFAMSTRQQTALVAAAVVTCNELTQRLARYEMGAAAEVLEGSSGQQLPPQLREAYRSLVDNLASYRPFLPDSLLFDADDDAGGDAADAAQPPGEGQSGDIVTIVFTDVQSSTALWEEFPQGMYAALQQHNAILRRGISKHGGYEVKTIGDAFMVSFGDARSAVAFALEAQSQLLHSEWPAELLQSPQCSRRSTPAGQLLWNGLRVRVGIHCGPVRVERNPVTHRCDYFGPPVNTAARIEADLGYGGLVGISSDVLERLGEDGVRELGAVVHPLGVRHLKGVTSVTEVSVLVPQDIVARCDVLQDLSSSQRPASTPPPPVSAEETTIVVSEVADRPGSPNARLALQLKRTVASCAVVSTALTDEGVRTGIQGLLTAAEFAADVSHGVLQTVLSSTCVVAWNAPRPCAAHATQCAHFLTVVQQGCDAAGVVSRAGAASGTALSGNLAGRRRRFAAVIAGSVELSWALSAAAQAGNARALVTGPVALHCSARRLGGMRVGPGSVCVHELLEEGRDRPGSAEDVKLPRLPSLWGVELDQADMVGSPLLAVPTMVAWVERTPTE